MLAQDAEARKQFTYQNWAYFPGSAAPSEVLAKPDSQHPQGQPHRGLLHKQKGEGSHIDG